MSIDSLYENVIAKLTDKGKILDISKDLLALTTNHERVFYVYDIMDNMKVLPKVQEITKTTKVSAYYRNRGNHCFQNKQDFMAWQYYNLSLLHAPLDSEDYCLALANRSAVFHSMKKYTESLQDIKEVLAMKYPEKLKLKLLKRQSSCEEILKKVKRNSENVDCELIQQKLSLKGPIDSRYPCASSKLEVVLSEEMGRHVIAKEDISVGEILVEEKPYFTLLLKSQHLVACSYCLSRNLNLMPCTKCTSALYCSDKCRDEAWKDYHATECCLMVTLFEMDFTKLELLALRTVIKARNDHPNWRSLLETIQEAENNVEFRGHVKIKDEWVHDSKYYTSDQWVYDSKYYASIHTLASNIEKRSVSDIFQKAVTAAVFLHFLSKYTNFMKPDDESQSEEIRKCVAGTLLLHIMTSPTNMHGLSTNTQDIQGNYVDELSLASAPYAYHSLLNHSCAPNVVRIGKLGTGHMILWALGPIRKGMQLFDNYGAHHAIEDRASRQRSLKFQYKFTCLCKACVNNWPTYIYMKRGCVPADIIRRKDKMLNATAMKDLQKGDKGTALKLFDPLCKLIEELDPYAPCAELADCQESLKQCMALFKGVVPYGYSQVITWDPIPKV